MSIRVENVYAGYTEYVDIIVGVSVEAKKSKVTSIIGPNGCGKTTLLKTIYGFLKPRDGKIFLGNEEVTGLPPYKFLKKGVAYLLQQRSIFPYLTVEANLEMGAYGKYTNKHNVREALEEVYGLFPILKEKRKSLALTLSGGQQRMLEVARCLAAHPNLILLDEPSAGLAPKVVKELYETLTVLKEKELTVLLIDQQVRAATSISDYVYVMEQGEVKFGAPTEEFERELKPLIKSWFQIKG